MNDEEFEKKLIDLTGVLQRPDPTATWKADILASARRKAATSSYRSALPPRWLMAAWLAAWIVIAWMSFTTPQSAGSNHPTNLVSLPEKSSASPVPEMDTSPQALVAYQRNFFIESP